MNIKNNEVNLRYILMFLIVVWGAWGGYYIYYQNWEALGASFTWLLAGGVFFAILQVQQTKRSTNAQLAIEMFRELRSPETKAILRYIYTLNREEISKEWKTDLNDIDSVMDKFELLGVLVNQGIIDKRIAIEAYAGPPALRCWYQLVHYIRQQGKDRGFYIVNYEDFVRQTVEYFENKNVEIIFKKTGEEDVPLVTELRKLIDEKNELRPRKLDEIRCEKGEKCILQKVGSFFFHSLS